MSRRFTKFRFPTPSERRGISFASLLLILLQYFMVRSLPWMLLWCMFMGVLFVSTPIASLWGQSPETTNTAPQPNEEINPQYEANVKAAYLYGFGNYIKWPDDTFADSTNPFIIGICGECQFEQALVRLTKVKKIQGRQLVVKKMNSIAELQPCHILFISRSIPLEQQSAIIKKMNNTSTLLVGEVPGFAEQGGGINFFLEDKIVRFGININAVRQEGLALNAKLLSLGKILPGTSDQQIQGHNQK